MQKYKFPSNIEDQHAIMRLSIFERNNDLIEGDQQFVATNNQLSSILLYMPTSIQFNDGLTFENVDMSNAVSLASDFIDALRKGSVGDAEAREAIPNLQTRALSRVAGSGGIFGGLASQALIRSGQVLNPRTALLFRGPILRQFSFAFKFIPSDKGEADQIQEIIKTIRLNSYPSVDVSQSESIFSFPNVFRISFVENPNSESGVNTLKMINIADTYCTAISTNYNPTANAFYEGGYPSEIDLTLTFQETRALNRNSIEQGF